MRAILCCSVTALATSAAAQAVWTVDLDNRPGANFTDIPAAVAAASPGDIIRVRVPSQGLYLSPSGAGVPLSKPLVIVGDAGVTRPVVVGGWYIQGIPAHAQFVLANLELIGGGPLIASFSNPGAIMLENVGAGASLGILEFWDTDLVILSHTQVYSNVRCLDVMRSNVMIDDCWLQSQAAASAGFGDGGPAMIVRQSKLVVTNSTLIGASAPARLPLAARRVMDLCNADVTIGKGCTLVPGSFYQSGPSQVDGVDCGGVVGPIVPSHIAVDPSAIVNGPWRQGDPLLIYDFSAQTGLRYQVTPTTLTVTHLASAQSLCILGIGALITTPWTNIVGPVFVDPNGAAQYWDLAPTGGTLTRTFGIPPGLPFGYQVALQAFELQLSGAIRTSNAVVAGIRQ